MVSDGGTRNSSGEGASYLLGSLTAAETVRFVPVSHRFRGSVGNGLLPTSLERTSSSMNIWRALMHRHFHRTRAIAKEGPRPPVPISVFVTLGAEVHEQMFRSGDQSDVKPSLSSSQAQARYSFY
ncbi:hypothetical protein TNCV_1089101 [Trichonephila clavipes]|uniref:Uncharacterized protein n=1 Tax=Trichonephila clavipes TaxID=2585209 RepID=A0A8X6VL70_TRICX|nr:hypothetical protein TNCV_1089101 [Trichonephila clavipes]